MLCILDLIFSVLYALLSENVFTLFGMYILEKLTQIIRVKTLYAKYKDMIDLVLLWLLVLAVGLLIFSISRKKKVKAKFSLMRFFSMEIEAED